jgi:hypothetical protein
MPRRLKIIGRGHTTMAARGRPPARILPTPLDAVVRYYGARTVGKVVAVTPWRVFVQLPATLRQPERIMPLPVEGEQREGKGYVERLEPGALAVARGWYPEFDPAHPAVVTDALEVLIAKSMSIPVLVDTRTRAKRVKIL